VAIFKALTPENQAHLLMSARLAYIAESTVKKSVVSLLEQQGLPEACRQSEGARE
jgi:hypothetical protein